MTSLSPFHFQSLPSRQVIMSMSKAERDHMADQAYAFTTSLLHTSVAVATLTSGFTFNTLLGQTFEPRHYFTGEQVEMLLALTFLFSLMSILMSGWLLGCAKVRPLDSNVPLIKMLTAYALTRLLLNSACFLTIILAVMAFQKAVGGICVAANSHASLCHLCCGLWSWR